MALLIPEPASRPLVLHGLYPACLWLSQYVQGASYLLQAVRVSLCLPPLQVPEAFWLPELQAASAPAVRQVQEAASLLNALGCRHQAPLYPPLHRGRLCQCLLASSKGLTAQASPF